MNIKDLFPIPVGMVDMDKPYSKKELSFILKQEKRVNMGNTTSEDSKILDNSALKSLRLWLEEQVKKYFYTTTNPKYDARLRITQSWINYTAQGQHHHKHSHPNSYISGVLYIQTNPDDKIYFHREGHQHIKFTPQEWNMWNSESWWYEAITGRLILFPSSLSHMVPSVEGEQTRISLSFNTYPYGILGEEKDLTGLILEA